VRLSNVLPIILPVAVLASGLGISWLAPIDHDAIRYTLGPVDDGISRLQQRIDSGAVRLKYEDESGYLRSVLNELDVPLSSQVLVFSKTSFQAARIGPRSPRALYFKDNLAVGFVRTGDVLEFAVLDPKQGVVFYTLDQTRASHPQFARRDVCLQCHLNSAAKGIPGLMVRSITPDINGKVVMSAGGLITDHRSPLKDRWGGWYVEGTSGKQAHMGNAVVQSSNEKLSSSDSTSNITDLKSFFDSGAYLTPHSDIVALMTLEHQTQMENLMIRAGWEARLVAYENGPHKEAAGEGEGNADAVGSEAAASEVKQDDVNTAVEELVEYMLFSGETKLIDPVKGVSGFAEEFQKAGIRDAKGRSLRDFDLTTRLFRYPCSFMIYTEAFDGMPAVVKERVYQRLFDVLSGKDNSLKFSNLTAADKKAILEILIATKKDLPGYFAG
jgi:hypothetical protein